MQFILPLNQQIECEVLCKKISKFIDSKVSEYKDLGDCILVMEIKRPLDYGCDSLLPKIEFKE